MEDEETVINLGAGLAADIEVIMETLILGIVMAE